MNRANTVTGTVEPIEVRRRALAQSMPVWEPMRLDQRLDRVATTHGQRPLVITDDETLTYDAVVQRSRAIADGLASLGVAPGDHVGIIMANYPDFVPIKFAVSRAGAVAIPFNYLYRSDELAYVLRQSRTNL